MWMQVEPVIPGLHRLGQEHADEQNAHGEDGQVHDKHQLCRGRRKLREQSRDKRSQAQAPKIHGGCQPTRLTKVSGRLKLR